MKPFKRSVEPQTNPQEEPSIKEESIKPFKVQATEELDATFNPHEEVMESEPKRGLLAGMVHFFSGFWGIVAAFMIFLIFALSAHAIESLSTLLSSGRSADYIYLAGVILLLLVLLLNALSNIAHYRRIQSVATTQEAFKTQSQNPNSDIIPLTQKLLKSYQKHNDPKVQARAKEIAQELKRSQLYPQIYVDLDEKLLSPIDAKAQKAIQNASLQAALSTAISPLPLLDMGLIAWRSVRLTREIAMLYGYRPNTLATMMLLKKGLFNIAFAGVSQLAIELSHEATSTTLVSKISHSTGEGIANGILLARLGYGIMEACRPLPSNEKREHFVKSIIASIAKAVKSEKEQK
ncbi:MAG: TIGR01620 family protein [Campylobacterota bacterium]|nr:TIGR01620 family protein [Campylobacterota bacterium]